MSYPNHHDCGHWRRDRGAAPWPDFCPSCERRHEREERKARADAFKAVVLLVMLICLLVGICEVTR